LRLGSQALDRKKIGKTEGMEAMCLDGKETGVFASEGVEEVFFIIDESIQVVGAVVREDGGVARIEGKIRFHDGHTLSFSHSSTDPDALRDKLRSACERIADFHDAEVFTYKLDGMKIPEPWFSLWKSAGNRLN
jgi:hypothetical protein